MAILKEELFEPVARYFRFRQGLTHIDKKTPISILDLGCGVRIDFYNFILGKHVLIKKYIGIDPLLDMRQIKKIIQTTQTGKIKLLKTTLSNKIPFKDSSVDYVFGFAFLEHIDYPEKIVHESIRILKTGGRAVFTSPTLKAKIFLETLSFKFNLLSRREIEEHKNYFTKTALFQMVGNESNVKVFHEDFEFGLNNLIVFEKYDE